MLGTVGLAKDYGDGLGLEPTDLEVGSGELVLLVGANGSGKSTLLGCCGGMVEATAGTVTVDGAAPGSRHARAVTSYLPDTPVLYDDLSVSEHLEYVAGLHGTVDWEDHAHELLERLGLEHRSADLPARFSRGLRQKTALAVGLLRPFDLLLADEPFLGLDAPAQQALVALLAEAADAGVAVVVASHQLDLAASATRCVGLDEGRVVYDGPADAAAIERVVTGRAR